MRCKQTSDESMHSNAREGELLFQQSSVRDICASALCGLPAVILHSKYGTSKSFAKPVKILCFLYETVQNPVEKLRVHIFNSIQVHHTYTKRGKMTEVFADVSYFKVPSGVTFCPQSLKKSLVECVNAVKR